MKNYINILIIVFLIFSCKSNKNNYLDFEKVKSDFLYQEEINCYNTDSIKNFLPLVASNKVKPILNEKFKSIFQGKIKEVDTLVTEHTYYPYNIQNSKNNIRITLFNTDDNWVNQITMLTYVKRGNLKNDYVLARFGGDQELFVESEGCFYNDSIYEITNSSFEYDIILKKNKLKARQNRVINLKNN